MNLNDHFLYKGTNRNTKRATNVPIVIKKAPSKKNSTTSTSLNWGKPANSIFNASSLLRSGGSSTKSSETENRIIIAITEGRGEARCEVGLAAINISHPELILCQISDTQNYINTLTKINILNPEEILIPKTFVENFAGNRLFEKIKKYFPKTKFTGVARNTFNKNRGLETIQELCIPSFNPVLLVLKYKYYALASASALLVYINSTLYCYYASGTLKVEYQESEGYAFIDVSTADRLELVSSTRPGQATKYSSLFGVLNKTFTRIGARTLRSAILQPLHEVNRIEERLECIGELIGCPEMLISVQAILQKIPSVDQLLTIATIMPDNPQSCSNRHLNYILQLNNLVDNVTPLKQVLQNASNKFYVDFVAFLGCDFFTFVKKKVRDVIHDEARPASGTRSVHQRCFAVKPGINGLLDLVRRTYTERIEELSEYVKSLAEKYDLPLTLANNNAKGYHIVLTLNKNQRRFMKTSDIPEEFIQVFRLAGSFTMKTVHLVNVTTRIDNILVEILKISNVIVYQIISELKKYVAVFHHLCENIGHLDLLQSLAEASASYGYVRPKFADYTEIREAHHPLLDFLCPNKPTANTISASKDYNVHIITGPSGSGKSILIRQAMLLQVMAQIGCYVPAGEATFRPADKMFSRIYLEDDMESGASSFVLEMKEIKYILTTMTENSLVIIDELCRSTSLEEGMALAMAICEKFANTSIFLYITTHFTTLAKIHDMYLNIKVWQMETIAQGDTPQDIQLDFKYNVKPGITNINYYGIYLVRNIWPDHVLKLIDEVMDKTKNTFVKSLEVTSVDPRMRLKYDLECRLRYLKSKGKLTMAEINKNLNEFQNKLDLIQFTPENQDLLILTSPKSYPPVLTQMEPENYQNMSRYNNRQDLIQFTPENQDLLNQNLFLTPSNSYPPIEPENYQNMSRYNNSQDLIQFTPEIQNQVLTFPRYNNNLPLIEFTPETQNQVVTSPKSYLPPMESETYQNISRFMNENPENVNLFIPEVNISYPNTSYNNNSDLISQDLQNAINYRKNLQIETEDFQFLMPLPKYTRNTSTPQPIVLGKRHKKVDVDSLREDLEVCSQVFSKYDSFEEGIRETSIQEELEICSQILSKCGSFEDDFNETKDAVEEEASNGVDDEEENNVTEDNGDQKKVKKEDDEKSSENNVTEDDDVSVDDKFKDEVNNMTEDEDEVLDKSGSISDSFNSDEGDKDSSKILNKTNERKDEESTSISAKVQNTSYLPKRQYQHYLSPKVIIEYGPDDASISFDNTDENIVKNRNSKQVNNKREKEELKKRSVHQLPEEKKRQIKTTLGHRKIVKHHQIPNKIKEIKENESLESNGDLIPDQKKEQIKKVLNLSHKSVCNKQIMKNIDSLTSYYSADGDDDGNIMVDKSRSSPTTSSNLTEKVDTLAKKRKLTDTDVSTSSPSKKRILGSTSPESLSTIRKCLPPSLPSDSTSGKYQPKRRMRRFQPPRKLSAKEIRKEFMEQDRKLYETDTSNSSEFNKYLQNYINRPTVKQLKNQKQIAIVRKGREGVPIVEIPKETVHKKKPFKLQRHWSSDKFNPSKKVYEFNLAMFSDNNAKPFKEFLNSKSKDPNMFNFSAKPFDEMPPNEEDITATFKNVVSKQKQKQGSEQFFSFSEDNEGKNSSMVKTPFGKFFQSASSYLLEEHPYSTQNNASRQDKTHNTSVSSYVPSGYYEENQKEIKELMNKYLNSPQKPKKNQIFQSSSLSSDYSF
ncbi:unnamed protein product [Brassicogethes aeneus]|uniref:DNA mismatch repair proteins mutS family domain-containing protein n=1 Tax=Brassicogethes aeneus TaxID=1431903 RepID=A0A9P0FMR9_BRAAE|nr:unnamed protein product [Brassicogethes aeneus]